MSVSVSECSLKRMLSWWRRGVVVIRCLACQINELYIPTLSRVHLVVALVHDRMAGSIG